MTLSGRFWVLTKTNWLICSGSLRSRNIMDNFQMSSFLQRAGRRYQFKINTRGTDGILDELVRGESRVTKLFCTRSFSVQVFLTHGVMSNNCCHVWDRSVCWPSL